MLYSSGNTQWVGSLECLTGFVVVNSPIPNAHTRTMRVYVLV